MKNLKDETLHELKRFGKSTDDIVAIYGDDYCITLENFLALADTDYDDGYGGQEVAKDLRILGKDFLMIRNTYDGSEWWEFVGIVPPENTETVACLTDRQAEKLREIIHPYDSGICSWGTLKQYNDEAKGADRY